MTKTNRVKSTSIGTVPQSIEQVREMILRIGKAQNETRRIKAGMDDQIQRIRDKYQAQAALYSKEITELSRGVQAYCEVHRDELTAGGRKKTADIGAGTVSWRTTPPKVSLRNIKGVIETFKKLGLNRLLRTKEEVNKEAILAEPDTVDGIKGITITQGEDFIIKPVESELEEVI